MNISVIGANGRSGQDFIKVALAAGHAVKAGVRGKSRLAPHPNLKVQTCDATNRSELKNLIEGQDAVVSLIGHVKNSKPTVQTEAMQILLEVIQKSRVKRIVVLTGTGVRFTGDKITLWDYILNLGVRMIDPSRVRDGINSCRLLEKSNLNWTIIRVLKLSQGKPGLFKLKEHGPAKLLVPRLEVAQAILQVLEDESFIKTAPIISN